MIVSNEKRESSLYACIAVSSEFSKQIQKKCGALKMLTDFMPPIGFVSSPAAAPFSLAFKQCSVVH